VYVRCCAGAPYGAGMVGDEIRDGLQEGGRVGREGEGFILSKRSTL
jgi:hypothetical protein